MSILRINELPEKEFTGDMIDHCFYVENMNQPEMRLVPLSSIFDRIKEEAIKGGLTVKMEGKKMMFISNELKIDWKELRNNFFNECATETPKEEIGKKVSMAPHDLFEWFKNEISEYLLSNQPNKQNTRNN